jgi:Domain of unknown function (DUF4174)
VNRWFVLVIAGFLLAPLSAASQSAPAVPFTPLAADAVELDQFVWTNRVVAVFSDSPEDPAFVEQMLFLARDAAALTERDIVVITDTDPAARTALRQKLRPRGFSVVWIDKDGAVRLRKPSPWTVRELTQAIDKTPIRLQELEERGAGG